MCNLTVGLLLCKKQKGNKNASLPIQVDPIYEEIDKKGPTIEMKNNDAYEKLRNLNK